jgi:hypothetical protein
MSRTTDFVIFGLAIFLVPVVMFMLGFLLGVDFKTMGIALVPFCALIYVFGFILILITSKTKRR